MGLFSKKQEPITFKTQKYLQTTSLFPTSIDLVSYKLSEDGECFYGQIKINNYSQEVNYGNVSVFIKSLRQINEKYNLKTEIDEIVSFCEKHNIPIEE